MNHSKQTPHIATTWMDLLLNQDFVERRVDLDTMNKNRPRIQFQCSIYTYRWRKNNNTHTHTKAYPYFDGCIYLYRWLIPICFGGLPTFCLQIIHLLTMTLHMLPNVVYTRFSYRNLRNTSEYCFQLITTMVLTVRQRMQIDVSDSPFSTLVGTSNGHKGFTIFNSMAHKDSVPVIGISN